MCAIRGLLLFGFVCFLQTVDLMTKQTTLSQRRQANGRAAQRERRPSVRRLPSHPLHQVCFKAENKKVIDFVSETFCRRHHQSSSPSPSSSLSSSPPPSSSSPYLRLFRKSGTTGRIATKDIL